MLGKIKKLKDNISNFIYPVTVAEAVYVDSTKTLKQAIADGSLGGGSTQVNVSGRSYALFTLRGGQIIVKKVGSSTTTLSYTFPNLDTNRHRRLFVWKGGSGTAYIDIPDGTLLADQALVYDLSTNTLTTKTGTFGNVTLSVNEFLLLYNNLGILGGILSKYVSKGDTLKEEEVITPKNYTATNFTGYAVQTLTFIGNELWAFDKDIDTSQANVIDPVTFQKIKGIPHTLGYWNSGDCNDAIDAIVQGNGTGTAQYTDNKVRVYYSVSTWSALTTLTPETVDFIDIDLFELNASGDNDAKVQACWGDHNLGNHNIVYIVTNDGRTIRKLMLGKGTNNLGSGIFTSGLTADRFNGTYKVLNVWSQDDGGGNVQDIVYHNGAIYNASKISIDDKGVVVLKHKLLLNGNIEKTKFYIPFYDNTTGNLVATMGSGEGTTIKDGVLYTSILSSPLKMFTFEIQ